VRTFDGNNFEELSEKPNGFKAHSSPWKTTSVIVSSQGRKVFAVLSNIPGSAIPSSVGIWPSKILFADNKQVISPICQDSIARDLKAIVGPWKAWLIFLNHDGWVCSINTDTAANDKYYLRHFFVPVQWHSALGNTSMAITHKGSVAMAVNSEIVIFHNGLDFEEKFAISGWVSAESK
jgi:hypothetical protein